MKIVLNNNRGGTIVTVVILTTAISILISVMLLTQYRAPAPQTTQALANARAALIKELKKKPLTKSFEAQKNDSTDSVTLWKENNFGSAFIEEEASPLFLTYHVVGFHKKDTAHLTVSCGGSLMLTDTTLILQNKDNIEGRELITGTVVQEDSTTLPRIYMLDKKALSESKKATDSLFTALDTLTPSATMSVFQERDFQTMGTSLGGDLFIDGSDIDINGKENVYHIKDDLQLTGAVKLKAATFIVGGEVRINDQSSLSGITIFVKGNLFISHESSIAAQIISYGSIEILDNSTVSDKSLILSLKKASADKASIYVRGNAKVDGTLFSRGTIHTFENSETTGILYSMSNVLHKGYHSGVIIAESVGSQAPIKKENNDKSQTPKDSTITAAPRNKIEGTITDILKPDEYPLPWFIGEKKIISWREKM